jgi:hypothetical protein
LEAAFYALLCEIITQIMCAVLCLPGWRSLWHPQSIGMASCYNNLMKMDFLFLQMSASKDPKRGAWHAWHAPSCPCPSCFWNESCKKGLYHQLIRVFCVGSRSMTNSLSVLEQARSVKFFQEQMHFPLRACLLQTGSRLHVVQNKGATRLALFQQCHPKSKRRYCGSIVKCSSSDEVLQR